MGRVIRRASLVLAVMGGLWIALAMPDAAALHGGGDAYDYWAFHLPHPYAGVEGDATFTYSPVAAFAIYPFTLLPLEVFRAGIALASVLALVWMAGPWALPLLLFPPVTFELYLGQVHLLIAAAIVAGMRRPAWWAVPLLTKVTPGIGVLWFAIRREWRGFVEAIGVTLVLVAVTFLVSPGLWAEWVAMLRASSPVDVLVLTPAPLGLRLALAAVIVLVAAYTNRAWALPIACYLALPTMWTFGASMLVACIPLALRHPVDADRARGDVARGEGELERGEGVGHVLPGPAAVEVDLRRG